MFPENAHLWFIKLNWHLYGFDVGLYFPSSTITFLLIHCRDLLPVYPEVSLVSKVSWKQANAPNEHQSQWIPLRCEIVWNIPELQVSSPRHWSLYSKASCRSTKAHPTVGERLNVHIHRCISSTCGAQVVDAAGYEWTSDFRLSVATTTDGGFLGAYAELVLSLCYSLHSACGHMFHWREQVSATTCFTG